MSENRSIAAVACVSVLASASLHALDQSTNEAGAKPRAGAQQLWESQPRMNQIGRAHV